MLDSVGAGLLTVNWVGAVDPPPGAGLATDMPKMPAVFVSPAGSTAVNLMVVTKVVVRSEPSNCTLDPLTKFVPFTVSVTAPLPAVTEMGLMLSSVGVGFTTPKSEEFEVPPPGVGLTTVIANVPPVVRKLESTTAASSCPDPGTISLVGRFAPANLATDAAVNPVPWIVNVKVAELRFTPPGFRAAMVGTGWSIVNDWLPEVPSTVATETFTEVPAKGIATNGEGITTVALVLLVTTALSTVAPKFTVIGSTN
jgi:hypothetical protein